jgi:riboflavin biosynthesis pyrimidine reductase
VGGGDLAAQLLAADAIHELDLTVAPTLVGRGPGARGASSRCGASTSSPPSASQTTASGCATSGPSSRSRIAS